MLIFEGVSGFPYRGPVPSALSKSAIKSLTSSIPTEIRTRSSVKPLASRTSAGMLAWDIKQGMLMRDFTLPAHKNNYKKRLFLIFSKTTLNSMLTHDSNQISFCKEAAIHLRPLSMVSYQNNTYQVYVSHANESPTTYKIQFEMHSNWMLKSVL